MAHRSQTGRPGVSQTRHPQGVMYPTVEPIPQGVVLAQSPRGAAMLIAYTNAQRPKYGPGVYSHSDPPVEALIVGQGPIDRGY